MSILHGKQVAGTGRAAIAVATASINPPTRIVLASGPITLLKISRLLLLYNNHPDHTRLLMRKAKVTIGARHGESVAVIAARWDEAGVKRDRALRHRSVLAVLSVGSVGRDRMDGLAAVHPLHGVADFNRDFCGRVERLRVGHLDHDWIAGRLG